MKCRVQGYDKKPFYYHERDGERSRIVAWTGAEEAQERLFLSLLDLVGDRVDYLLKESIACDTCDKKWKRIQGGLCKQDLLRILKSHRIWFFGDSGFQFCARIAEKEDYFAYDDHGIFWIYSSMAAFEAMLEDHGLENRNDELICASGHWHVGIKDSERMAASFITALKAVSVYYNE